MKLVIELAPKMMSLFEHKRRYRIAYGGRSGTKSYGYGRMAVARMCQRRTDLAICREYHTTIKSSVHKVLSETIATLNVGEEFEITENKIINRRNGSKVIYQHLHDNVTEVKGLEGTDICWLFEGHDLSEDSWKILDPTIRRTPRMTEDPEFWIEFNPQFEDDFIYRNFIIKQLPNSVVVYITYLDNPWCPAEMKAMAEQCKAESVDEYNHIWLGYPRNVGGLVYPQFNMDHHVRDADLGRLEHVGNFFMGQDPHYTYYPFCAWLGRISLGDGAYEYYWYNEFPTVKMMGGKFYHEIRQEKKCTLTLMQRAKMFRVMDNTTDKTYHGINVQARGIDTRYASGVGAGSTTNNTRGVIVEMADPQNGGLNFETPPPFMIDGQRDNIRQLLSWDQLVPMHEYNRPHMYFLPHCENLIDMMRFHRFDRDGKDKEDEKRKDPSDAMKIAMATAQQYKHIDRVKKIEVEIPETDAVDSLAEAYLGKGSALTHERLNSRANRRLATPVS